MFGLCWLSVETMEPILFRPIASSKVLNVCQNSIVVGNIAKAHDDQAQGNPPD